MAKTYAGQNSKASVRNFFVNFIKYESVDGQGDPVQYMSVPHVQQTKKHKKPIKLHLMYKFCSNSWQMLLRSRTICFNASLIILFCLETNMSELCPEITFFTVCLFRSAQLRLGFEIMKLIHSNSPAFQLNKILIGHSRIQRN